MALKIFVTNVFSDNLIKNKFKIVATPIYIRYKIHIGFVSIFFEGA